MSSQSSTRAATPEPSQLATKMAVDLEQLVSAVATKVVNVHDGAPHPIQFDVDTLTDKLKGQCNMSAKMIDNMQTVRISGNSSELKLQLQSAVEKSEELLAQLNQMFGTKVQMCDEQNTIETKLTKRVAEQEKSLQQLKMQLESAVDKYEEQHQMFGHMFGKKEQMRDEHETKMQKRVAEQEMLLERQARCLKDCAAKLKTYERQMWACNTVLEVKQLGSNLLSQLRDLFDATNIHL